MCAACADGKKAKTLHACGLPNFTPGPWRVERGDVFGQQWQIVENVQEIRDSGTDTRGANARLIAAAPDLYAALLGLVDSFMVRHNASGEPMHTDCTLCDRIHAASAALAKARS